LREQKRKERNMEKIARRQSRKDEQQNPQGDENAPAVVADESTTDSPQE